MAPKPQTTPQPGTQTTPQPGAQGQDAPDDATELPDGITPDWLAQLCSVLGLDPATDDAELILQAARDAATDGQNAPSQVAASAKRIGMELIDTDSLASLRHDAAEGRKQVAASQRRERETAVDDAIRTGRITPSRREHWLKLLEADPAMKDVLASTPANIAVPVTALGHSHDDEAATTGQPRWFR